jgi:hypothetical protein
VILALGGVDRVDSRGGDDLVDVRDGVEDTVTCGSGNDTVKADGADLIDAQSCETIQRL